MKKLLLVDDHPIVLMGMTAFVDRHRLFKEVDHAPTGSRALKMLQATSYDLIILDVHLPDYEIISLVKAVRHLVPNTPILMFSIEPPKLYVRRLILIGISGFIDKSCTDEELLFAISSILAGRVYFSSEILMGTIMDRNPKRKQDYLQHLSDREIEILSLVLKGKNSTEISDILNLHKSSIATYRARVFEKLGLKSNFELFKWALKEGLITS